MQAQKAKPAQKSPYKISVMTSDDPEVTQRFNQVLEETIEAMQESGIRYAFIGGIASGGLGRPRSTNDIDLFVPPEDADNALRALAKKGFRTEKTDASWLFKGFKQDILVDVIFKSKGEIYLDNEMLERLIVADYHGMRVQLVAPEDLLIIKASAHSELTPSHWHDATALLSHANLDWEYLLRRARRAPRRVLSLLLYAQSSDIWVPNWVINELYRSIFGDIWKEEAARPSPYGRATGTQAPGAPGFGAGAVSSPPRTAQAQIRPVQPPPSPPGVPPQAATPGRPFGHGHGHGHGPGSQAYVVPHLREILAEDPHTAELDIQIEQSGNCVLLRGEVMTDERKDQVERIARERFPEFVIESQIRVLNVSGPTDIENVEAS